MRLVERSEAEHAARLHALRGAAQQGIADIEAGNFRSFDSPDALGTHLAAMADELTTA